MNGLHVARVLLLTRLRRLLDRSDRRRAQLIALLGFSPVLYHLARTGARTTVEGLVGHGGLLPSLFIGMVVMQAFRTVQQFGSFAGMEQLVPFATLRGTVTGFVLADAVTLMVLLMVPVTAFILPFTVVTGLVLAPVLLVAGLSMLVFGATVIGTLAGMVARRLIAVYQGGHRFLLRVLALVAIFFIVDRSVRAWIEPMSVAVADGLGEQAMATLLAPVTGTTASATGLLLFIVPVLVAVPLFRPLTRLTEHAWLHDPASTDDSRTGGAGFTGHGTRLYARTLWMRSLRSPERLSHLLIAVFMLFPLAGVVLGAPGLAGVVVLFLGAWLTGASFGLNPLGDDVDQLPLLRHLDLDPEELLWGRLVAGLVLGLPIIVVGTVLGIVGGVPVVLMLVAAVAAVVVAVAMTGAGLGLGTASPRFDAVQRYGGLRARTPTTLPVLGHMFGTQVAFGVVMVAVFFPAVFELVPVLAPLRTGVVRVLVLTMLGGLLGAAGTAGWWFARDRLRRYEVD